MAKKANNGKNIYRSGDLWIAPSSSLKQPAHQSDWKLRRVEPGESNKFLALADIALGLKPKEPKIKRGDYKTRRSA
ncbi:MAG TPA: hypothetical protein VGN44_03435 [Candidatus Angelobacter sp.]|jgi:hypothetical protein